MKRRTKLLIGLLVAGLLLAATGTAWAEEPAVRTALRGQVKAIEGDTLLVTTPAGEEQRVVTGEATRFWIAGTREPSIADIDVGDYVGVWGERNEEGDLAASVVIVVPAELAQRRFVAQGQVTAVNGLTITVDAGRGKGLVVTDGSTRFLIPGVEVPGIEDVSVGDPLLALGRPDDEGNLRARLVAVVTPGQVRRHTIRGLITDIRGDSLTLLTRLSEVQVETNDNTVFRIPGAEDPGIDDLNVRDLIIVVGTWKADQEAFAARAVTLIPRWPSHLRFLRGEVTGIEGRTLVLEALQGEVAVMTNGDTIFRMAGVEDPGLDDLRVGDKVGVLVARSEEGDGGLLARVVLVRRPDESVTEALAAPVEAVTTLLESYVNQASDS
jgi:hypothetical protein